MAAKSSKPAKKTTPKKPAAKTTAKPKFGTPEFNKLHGVGQFKKGK